jgi:hypothetical protein
MTDPTIEYVRILCAAGHRHRRYPRWSEVDLSVRLPEQQWRWRWRLDQRCAVAVASALESHRGLFQPCARKPVSRTDICRLHSQLERRVASQGRGPGCQAPLLQVDGGEE